jgi:hypothetical protein
MDAVGSKMGDKSGHVPYSYARVDGEIDTYPEHEADVRRIFMRKKMRLSQRAFARELNEAGIPALYGTCWYHSSVSPIIQNAPIYHGAPMGESANYWPAILAA